MEQESASGKPQATQQPARPRYGRMDLGLEHVTAGIERAKKWLFGMQHAEGYWSGELEADSMLEADYIFLHMLFGSGEPKRMEGAVREILRHQNEDGGWSIYPNGPSNISLGVKCYFALKLMGWSKDHPVLVKARTWILANGGRGRVQYLYEDLPVLHGAVRLRCCSGRAAGDRAVPELVLLQYLRDLLVVAGDRCSAFDRLCEEAVKKIEAGQGIEELFVGGRENANLHLRWDTKKLLGWRNIFLLFDRLTHWLERVHIRPLRKVALKRAEKWMLDRLEMSDGLGAIYPAMMNAIIALRCLGYSADDPQVIRAMDEFEKLGIEDPGVEGVRPPTFRMQPCMSPVWDTAYAMYALGEAGVSKDDPRLINAADWILSRKCGIRATGL